MKIISNRRRLWGGATVLALLFLGAQIGTANPIQVAYSPVMTQPSSNGDSQVATWASDAIDTFNTNSYAGSPLPALGALSLDVIQSGPGPSGWTFGTNVYSKTLDLTGFTGYIVMVWGSTTITGEHGTADYLYYVPGDTSNWTFWDSHTGASGDGSAAMATGGLSGIRTYGDSVPDSGATLALLGLGLLGLAAFRRRKVRS